MTIMIFNAETKYWDDRRGQIVSHNGGWRVGETVRCQGYSLLDELIGQISYFQLMILNVVGYLPERRLADWLEAAYMGVSYPDHRIWCNYIGSLAASADAGPVVATVAGILASDSSMYGSRPLLSSAPFIQQALKDYKAGKCVEAIVQQEVDHHRGKPNIIGFARPMAKGDERIPVMERVANQLGYKPGEHLQLAYEIEEVLKQKYGERMNVNGYVSAFLSDQGLSAEQIYTVCVTCVASGVTACYVDSSKQPPGSFLPLRCEDVIYEGKAPRSLPEK